MKAAEFREAIKGHEQFYVAIGQNLSLAELRDGANGVSGRNFTRRIEPDRVQHPRARNISSFALENTRNRETTGERRDATSIP
jgi:hypothetical protein